MFDMKNVLFILLLFGFPAVYSQNTWQWGRDATGVGESWAVATDTFGNIYAGGSAAAVSIFGTDTLTCTTMHDAWAKFDSTGAVIWGGGVCGESVLINIATDLDGNLIVFGSIEGDSIQIGGTSLHNIYSMSSCQYYLAKISPSGSVLWALKDGNVVGHVFGGAGSVTTDNSGNIYITSIYSEPVMNIGSTTLTSAGSIDVFVAKYDPSGNLVWARSIGGSNGDACTGITVTPDNSVYVSCTFSSPSITFGSYSFTNPYTGYRSLIAKFSSSGDPLWAQDAGGSHGVDWYSAISHDNSGNIYMAGVFADTSITFGSVTITRPFPGSVPKKATYLVKFSSADTALWGQSIGSPTRDLAGYAITTNNAGNTWISGSYLENADIASHTLVYTPGPDPMYIACFDSTGTVVEYNSLTSGGDDQAYMACDKAGNMYICGDYMASTTYPSFIIGPDTLGLAYERFFLAKYGPTRQVLPDRQNHIELPGITILSPNPAKDEMQIKCPYLIRDVSIYSIMGKMIYNNQFAASTIQINVSAFQTGVYLVKINGSILSKFFKL
jgi:hypothetical protein